MELKVIGAGLPRTGTTSLRAALEQLLDAPCYHMFELIDGNRDGHGVLWWQALQGDDDALEEVLQGYGAAVDWPAAVMWRRLLAKNPDAIVVLSHRGDADTWWASVDRTVWAAMRRPNIEPMIAAFNQSMRAAIGLGDDWDVPAVAKRLYRRIYDDVVASVAPEQLVIWQASEGWDPLCRALGVPVPDADFFHLNTTAEFRQRGNLDESP